MVLAVSSALSSPAAASEGPATVDPNVFVAHLSPGDIVKWRSLTHAQQREALALLADPRVGRGFTSVKQAKEISSKLDVLESDRHSTPLGWSDGRRRSHL